MGGSPLEASHVRTPSYLHQNTRGWAGGRVAQPFACDLACQIQTTHVRLCFDNSSCLSLGVRSIELYRVLDFIPDSRCYELKMTHTAKSCLDSEMASIHHETIFTQSLLVMIYSPTCVRQELHSPHFKQHGLININLVKETRVLTNE